MCFRTFYHLYLDSTVSQPPRKFCTVWQLQFARFFTSERTALHKLWKHRQNSIGGFSKLDARLDFLGASQPTIQMQKASNDILKLMKGAFRKLHFIEILWWNINYSLQTLNSVIFGRFMDLSIKSRHLEAVTSLRLIESSSPIVLPVAKSTHLPLSND